MKLDAPFDTNSLAALGTEAARLLCAGDINTLPRRFGYARALDREPATAIQDDLRFCLSQRRAGSLMSGAEHPVPSVTYCNPNASRLLGVIECLLLTEFGAWRARGGYADFFGWPLNHGRRVRDS